MLILKNGASNVVFMIKNDFLPKDDVSSAAMLRILAEKAFKESGINIKGNIELETFSSADETIVFAHDKYQVQLYKFESVENMFDASIQILLNFKDINASMLFSNSEYYILVHNNAVLNHLMSEYDGKPIANSETINKIVKNGKILTDISNLSDLYIRRNHNG